LEAPVKLRLLFATLLTLAAFSAPVVAQPAPSPGLQGDITIVDGQDLETSLENALTNAVTEATDQLSTGTTVGGLFSSPAFLTTVFALVNAILVFLTTNAVKLQTMLKGNKTLLLASLLSAVTSGLGVYFGPGAALGVPERSALAVAAALGTLGGAVGIHETRRQQQTGKRKPERKADAKAKGDSTVGKLTKLGPRALAVSLGLPPFVTNPIIDSLPLAEAERIIREMGKERALTLGEIEADQDKWKAENPVTEEELEGAQEKLKLRRRNQQHGSSLQDPQPVTEGNE